jgi:hypothetical protein
MLKKKIKIKIIGFELHLGIRVALIIYKKKNSNCAGKNTTDKGIKYCEFG